MSYVSEAGASEFAKPFEGIITNLERRFAETNSESVKAEISQYMYEVPCQACGGKRFRPETLAVRIGGLNIAELSDLPITKIKEFLNTVELLSLIHI